jgi:hypothetical protein
MTADALAHLMPDVVVPSLPFIGLYAIAVRSLDVLRDALRRGGLSFAGHDGYVLAHFPPALGRGGWVFVETQEHVPWRRG